MATQKRSIVLVLALSEWVTVRVMANSTWALSIFVLGNDGLLALFRCNELELISAMIASNPPISTSKPICSESMDEPSSNNGLKLNLGLEEDGLDLSPCFNVNLIMHPFSRD